jgi:hypothetical protein
MLFQFGKYLNETGVFRLLQYISGLKFIIFPTFLRIDPLTRLENKILSPRSQVIVSGSKFLNFPTFLRIDPLTRLENKILSPRS